MAAGGYMTKPGNPTTTTGRGTQPCLDLALLADELYERVRCRVPGCDDTRCHQARPGGNGRP